MMRDCAFAARVQPPARTAPTSVFRLLTACIAFTLGAGLFAAPQEAQRPPVRIGTAVDGAGDLRFRDEVQQEIVELLENRYKVEFPENRQLTADWSAERVPQNIDALLGDPEVDVVIVLGVAGPAYAATLSSLRKPVIAAIVLDPESQGVPITTKERTASRGRRVERIRVSGVHNLTYLSFDLDLASQVKTYREVTTFTHLAFLTPESLGGSRIAGFQSKVTEELKNIGLKTTFVTVGGSIDAVLRALPDDADAALLGAMHHLTEDEFGRLIQGLIDRKIPSLSLVGHRDVHRGVLAGLVRDRNQPRLVRRIALNLLNILLGEDASEIPVDFKLDRQLTINMATARAIGIDPTYSILTEAELVADANESFARRLSLPAVLREADRVNLDLLVSGKVVEGGLESVKLARANLLPQIQAVGLNTASDGNGASLSQNVTSGSVSLSQLIYSESARSGLEVERSRQVSRQEARVELRLDVLVSAAVGYLEILRSKTVEQIQRRNLRLTRSNLDLAQTRLDLGSGDREEVLRWRNQIAVDRRNVIDAGARLGQAEVALNSLLNRPLSERFQTVETGLNDPELTLNFQRLGPYIKSPGRFDAFREFMTQYAWGASPELRQLDASIRAGERTLLAAKRAFYLPTISFDAQTQTFKNSGDAFSALPNQGNANWSLGVRASLPLFQGGVLRANRSQAQIALAQLRLQRESTRIVVGQAIQNELFQAGATFAGISLAREALDAARENLQIVRDRYSEGQVDIIRLLDAQTQALAAELQAANAVFAYLIDLMQVQRAAGRFDYFLSASDRNVFLQELALFFRSKGLEVENQ